MSVRRPAQATRVRARLVRATPIGPMAPDRTPPPAARQNFGPLKGSRTKCAAPLAVLHWKPDGVMIRLAIGIAQHGKRNGRGMRIGLCALGRQAIGPHSQHEDRQDDDDNCHGAGRESDVPIKIKPVSVWLIEHFTIRPAKSSRSRTAPPSQRSIVPISNALTRPICIAGHPLSSGHKPPPRCRFFRVEP